MTEKVVVHVSELTDLQTVSRALGARQELVPCQSVDLFMQRAAADDARCGVLDLHGFMCENGNSQSLIGLLSKRVVPLRLVIQARDLAVPRIRLIRQFAGSGLDFRLTIGGIDHFNRDVQRSLGRGSWRTAHAPLLRLVAKSIPPEIERIVMGALLLGHMRWSVTEFASLIGMTDRTLERQFNRPEAPKVRDLLCHVLTAHILYYSDELAMPMDEVATELDFASPQELKHFLKRKGKDTIARTLRGPLSSRPEWDHAFVDAAGQVSTLLQAHGSVR